MTTGITQLDQETISNQAWTQGTMNSTNVASEAKVNATRLSGRESIRIYNNGSAPVFFGPSGVTLTTGEPLQKNQSVTIQIGDQLGVFVISAATQQIIVQEFA